MRALPGVTLTSPDGGEAGNGYFTTDPQALPGEATWTGAMTSTFLPSRSEAYTPVMQAGLPPAFNRRAAVLLVFYLGLIYLTLPLLPPAVSWFKASFGASSMAAAGPLAAAAAAAGLARFTMSRAGRGRVLRLVPVFAFAAALLYSLRANPVEQVHLLEYGLVGWLVHAAWDGGGRRALGGLALWGAGGVAAGLLDELIQGYLPNRFFDWRDVGVNSVSVALGLAAGLIASRRSAPREQEDGSPFSEPAA